MRNLVPRHVRNLIVDWSGRKRKAGVRAGIKKVFGSETYFLNSREYDLEDAEKTAKFLERKGRYKTKITKTEDGENYYVWRMMLPFNPIPRKGVGTRKFKGVLHYYIGRTIYYSKALFEASKLRDAGLGIAITRRKDAGYLIWATQPVYVDLMEPIWNPKYKATGRYKAEDIVDTDSSYYKQWRKSWRGKDYKTEKSAIIGYASTMLDYQIIDDEGHGTLSSSSLDWSVKKLKNPEKKSKVSYNPAVSRKQQQLFGIALGMKRGEIPKSYSPEASRIARTMSERKIREFAVMGNPEMTEKSRKLFLDYAKDAGNWGGTPLIGGNVGGSKEDRGNLTHLKKLGLIKTFRDEGLDWIMFTDKGINYAKVQGINLSMYKNPILPIITAAAITGVGVSIGLRGLDMILGPRKKNPTGRRRRTKR